MENLEKYFEGLYRQEEKGNIQLHPIVRDVMVNDLFGAKTRMVSYQGGEEAIKALDELRRFRLDLPKDQVGQYVNAVLGSNFGLDYKMPSIETKDLGGNIVIYGVAGNKVHGLYANVLDQKDAMGLIFKNEFDAAPRYMSGNTKDGLQIIGIPRSPFF